MKIGVWEVRVRGKNGENFATVLHPVPGNTKKRKDEVMKATAEQHGYIMPLGATWQTNGYTTIPFTEIVVNSPRPR